MFYLFTTDLKKKFLKHVLMRQNNKRGKSDSFETIFLRRKVNICDSILDLGRLKKSIPWSVMKENKSERGLMASRSKGLKTHLLTALYIGEGTEPNLDASLEDRISDVSKIGSLCCPRNCANANRNSANLLCD